MSVAQCHASPHIMQPSYYFDTILITSTCIASRSYWEHWHGSKFGAAGDPRGSSKNHHMLTGGFGLFLLDVVGGLRADHDRSGGAALTVDLTRLPIITAVGSATTAVESAAGRAQVSWAFCDGGGTTRRLSVSVSAPLGVQATILRLPAPTRKAILRAEPEGRVLWRASDANTEEEVIGEEVFAQIVPSGALSMNLGAGEHALEFSYMF